MDVGWYLAALGYPIIILGLIYLVFRSRWIKTDADG